jgi:hypothetical protein
MDLFITQPDMTNHYGEDTSLTANYQYLRIVAAGFDLRSPIGNLSPLFSSFAHHQLYGIGSEGAYDLVAGQLARYGVTFEAPAIWAEVARLAGEEPFLLRLLGQQLTEQARGNAGVIGLDQVRAAAEDFFIMPQAAATMSYAWQVLGVDQPIHLLIAALAYSATLDMAAQRALIGRARIR